MKSFLLEYTTFLTIGVLLVGTVERLMSVKVPFHHRTHVTGKMMLLPVCSQLVQVLTLHFPTFSRVIIGGPVSRFSEP